MAEAIPAYNKLCPESGEFSSQIFAHFGKTLNPGALAGKGAGKK
jgi:hypothetical protein